MGYFSNLHLEMQEDNAHLQSQEPDFMDYAHEVMKSKEFAKDMDVLFPEIDLSFLDIRDYKS